MFTAILFFIVCDDEDDKKELIITKYKQNGQECYNTRCYVVGGDTVCYKNPGTPKAEILPKSSVCYDVLKAADPPSTPTNKPPVEKSPTSQFNIEFLDSTNKKFGYDPVKGSFDISTSINERRINYLSIKEGGELQIKVSISSASRNMFSSFYSKIRNSAISFDSISLVDSISLFNSNDTVDTISIYGRWATFVEIPVTIAGINRSGTEKCLVCSDTCDEAILARCYEEKGVDSVRLYRINNPGFNYPDTVIRSTFNNVLKQAVVYIKGVIKNNYTKNDWDNNGNGILDLFPARDSVPPERFEHDSLRALVERQYNGCLSCASADTLNQQPKAFILPSKIYGNWILVEPASSGDDSIVIQYSREIESDEGGMIWRKVNFSLQGWDGSRKDEFQINSVILPDDGIRKNRMIVKLRSYTLNYDHIKNDVLVWKDYNLGFTYPHTSCAWVNGNMNIRDLLHEVLHMRVMGKLVHTPKDTLNMMYPITKPYTQLRYRIVEYEKIQELGQRQWDVLN